MRLLMSSRTELQAAQVLERASLSPEPRSISIALRERPRYSTQCRRLMSHRATRATHHTFPSVPCRQPTHLTRNTGLMRPCGGRSY